jgi:diguanylate cyclase (GGDEF)-like protein
VVLAVGGIHGLGGAGHAHRHHFPAAVHAAHHERALAPRTARRHSLARDHAREMGRRHYARRRHRMRRYHARRHRAHRRHRYLLRARRHRYLLRARRHRYLLRARRHHLHGRVEAHIAQVAAGSPARGAAATPTEAGSLIVPGIDSPSAGASGAAAARLPATDGDALIQEAPIQGLPGRRATAARHRSTARSRTHPAVRVASSEHAGVNVIQRIERVVPLGVWIALAAALALAGTAGVATIVAGRRARVQTQRLAAVSAQALTDPLTGVLNRRGFLAALERELARARRYGRPFALAYVDVRGLKAVNDSEGHLAGDELLCEAAGILEDSARADDVVGRIGGDELALLLGEQSGEGADVVANRIKAQVPERRAALRLREPWDLTIGTASYPADGTSADELLEVADRRLYEQRGIEIR